jgi:transposase-like protein
MAFNPPFCPNPECIYHHPRQSKPPNWYRKKGTFSSLLYGTNQRYQCKSCQTTLSNRSFSVDLYTKRTVDLRRIFFSINAGTGIRSLARQLGVNKSVIVNRLQRLSRQSMGISASLFSQKTITEDLAVDGFESFVYSQYFPNNYTIAVGSRSQVLYDVDYAQLRRKGQMTKGQKERKRKIIPPGRISLVHPEKHS